MLGFILGVVSQPFWLFVGLTSGQWAISVLAMIYAVLHFRGYRNNT
jgi:Ni/Fe-hydrogenase subunit HybB-like protein